MRVEISRAHPGQLLVSFEDADFRLKDKWGAEAWRKAKDELKANLPYPASRWDEDLQCWVVEDNKTNRNILSAINEKYFQDKDQLKLI